MSRENQWLEDVVPIKIVVLKGTFVGFRGCSLKQTAICEKNSLRCQFGTAINCIKMTLEVQPQCFDMLVSEPCFWYGFIII